MYKYSNKSNYKLKQAHPLLQALFNEVIKYADITIVETHRSNSKQTEYYNKGLSKLKAGQSKHNRTPSEAIDFAVYHKNSGVSWNEKDILYTAGLIEGIAHQMGIPVRMGAKWDHQWVSENGFFDGGHIELEVDKISSFKDRDMQLDQYRL